VPIEPLPIVRAADLDAAPPEAQWLVRDIWGKAAVGIIGGAPKVGKSWFGLDLAVSVASGTPCLGHFEAERGLALIYLAEDGLPAQRKRIAAICEHRGRSIESLDLHVITAPVLRLDVPADRERLSTAVARLRPKLLVLDPLVRLHRLDENSALDISGLLSFLRELQRAHDVAIALVHHASKKHRARPGQALRGSSDIHAFGDDLAHLVKPNEQDLVLTLEHRHAPSIDPLRLRLVSRKDGEGTHLELADAPPPARHPEGPPEDRVVVALRATAPRPMTRQELRDHLRINNNRLGEGLVRLEGAGRVVRTPTGWTVPADPVSDLAGASEPMLF